MSIPVSAVAHGTLTSDGTVPTAADTVVVGSVTYTFRASVSTTANEVKIGSGGSAVADTMTALAAAINAGAGSGTTYGSLTVVNPDVYATSDATHVYVFSKVPGTVGNFIPTTETSSHLSFGGSVLASGTNGLAAAILAAMNETQMNSQLEAMFGPAGSNPVHA